MWRNGHVIEKFPKARFVRKNACFASMVGNVMSVGGPFAWLRCCETHVIEEYNTENDYD